MHALLKRVAVVVCFLSLALTARASSGRAFYVDAVTGDDAHTAESPSKAWKTVAAVNTHRFRPGDHLYFHAAQIFPGTMQTRGSGTYGSPIVVTRFGKGKAPRLVGNGDLATILLTDVSFWTVQDIEVTNDASAEGKRNGILLQAVQSGETVRGITIQRVHIFNVRGLTGEDNAAKDTGGIGIFAARLDRPARFDGVLIRDCNIEHVDNVGIWLNSYPLLNPMDPMWVASSNKNIRVIGNHISDTGRNAIIVRQTLAPVIEGNTVVHSSTRHHGNAIFTRSTRDAIIRRNEVSFTGTEASGENAAFDADIDSIHTVIEYNWSHDNQGGLFSLCNNPSEDANVTDGTVIRFNVSENDGVRAFGFSGHVTHSTIYNNTVLIGPGTREAIVEARPFLKSKPRYADGATFFNNTFLILGEAFYDFAQAQDMQFDSNCTVGAVKNPFPETRAVILSSDSVTPTASATSWKSLSEYRSLAKTCGASSHRSPERPVEDITGAGLRGSSFHGAVRP